MNIKAEELEKLISENNLPSFAEIDLLIIKSENRKEDANKHKIKQRREKQREWWNKRLNQSGEKEKERNRQRECKRKKRLNLSEEEKEKERKRQREWRKKRLNLSEEEKEKERKRQRECQTKKRLNLSEEEKEKEREKQRGCKRKKRLNLSEEEKEKVREKQRGCKRKKWLNLSEEEKVRERQREFNRKYRSKQKKSQGQRSARMKALYVTEETMETEESIVDEWAPEPNEPRYCLCNQVSYGDMVACDNPDCLLEWFHFACVDITAPPKGKWYCPRCATSMKRRGRKQ